jgi:sulfonate transport system substrate-binding protein
VLARETGLSEDVALYTVRQYRIQPAPLDEHVVREARAVLDRFRSAGMLASTRDPAGAFDASFNGALA